jgi:hypothetical protein
VVRIPQQDSAVRAFQQTRTNLAAQVETLKRYQGGGGVDTKREGFRRRVLTQLTFGGCSNVVANLAYLGGKE